MPESRIAHYSRQRTILANERTFLSYVRTALTLFAAGVTFIRFFGIELLSIVGYIFVVLSVVLVLLGSLRYRKTKSHIKNVK
jgi:putative membrane protein